MKYKTFFLMLFICLKMFPQLPEGFVYVKTIIPDLHVELKYNTPDNFVGKRIDGYQTNNLILTKKATLALKRVHEALQEKNLCLKVYDGYRPQRAVNYFIKWAQNLSDTLNKQTFYPDVAKANLFAAGYIASKSGHSKGSTVDVTLIDGNTGNPLDMGSVYDFFGESSWLNYSNITQNQKKNRQLLQDVMLQFGFKNYVKEWWHFTLKEEPFANTYFNFIIE